MEGCVVFEQVGVFLLYTCASIIQDIWMIHSLRSLFTGFKSSFIMSNNSRAGRENLYNYTSKRLTLESRGLLQILRISLQSFFCVHGQEFPSSAVDLFVNLTLWCPPQSCNLYYPFSKVLRTRSFVERDRWFPILVVFAIRFHCTSWNQFVISFNWNYKRFHGEKIDIDFYQFVTLNQCFSNVSTFTSGRNDLMIVFQLF